MYVMQEFCICEEHAPTHRRAETLNRAFPPAVPPMGLVWGEREHKAVARAAAVCCKSGRINNSQYPHQNCATLQRPQAQVLCECMCVCVCVFAGVCLCAPVWHRAAVPSPNEVRTGKSFILFTWNVFIVSGTLRSVLNGAQISVACKRGITSNKSNNNINHLPCASGIAPPCVIIVMGQRGDQGLRVERFCAKHVNTLSKLHDREGARFFNGFCTKKKTALLMCLSHNYRVVRLWVALQWQRVRDSVHKQFFFLLDSIGTWTIVMVV